MSTQSITTNRGIDRSLWRRSIVINLTIAFGLLLGGCGMSLREKQEALAQDLGVPIDDYQAPSMFPLGYLDETLKPGTPMADVHQVIRGYEKVLHCEGSSRREIYYYYSDDDGTAIRIEVWYGERAELIRINGEDNDSRTIRAEGCLSGRLDVPLEGRHGIYDPE